MCELSLVVKVEIGEKIINLGVHKSLTMNRNETIIATSFLVLAITILSLEPNIPLQAQNASVKSLSGQDSVSGVEKEVDTIRNPDFDTINATSGLPLYWYDSFGSCGSIFNCAVNTTDGWFGNHSFQLSTRNNTNNTWSWISSQEIGVRPDEKFGIIAHMKLNEWAAQSHIVIEGLDSGIGEWYRIKLCPAGINGPIEWKVFDCEIKVPTNTSAIVVTLNAGWSTQPDKNAITTFDAIHAYKTV